MSVRYTLSRYFEKKKKQLIRTRCDFVIVYTTYTKTIKQGKNKEIFTDTGKGDKRTLYLINLVRADAQKYLSENGEVDLNKNIDYFKLFKRPKVEQVLKKIDIKSAYWDLALNAGIISQKTNQVLIDSYEGEPIKEMKDARLKALGSLATKHRTCTYESGILIEEIIEKEYTTDLYIEINRKIDELMAECQATVAGVVYYYWDCVFISNEFENEAIDFFRKKGFNISCGETRLDYVTVGKTGFLISTSDKKCYMVKKEDVGLLIDEKKNNEYNGYKNLEHE